jgi:hypothetical protein
MQVIVFACERAREREEKTHLQAADMQKNLIYFIELPFTSLSLMHREPRGHTMAEINYLFGEFILVLIRF